MNEVISVVGGGWSVKGVDLARIPGDFIIGVNESGVLMPKVHAVVTMDRLWTENRWDLLQHRKRPLWARRSALQNIAWDTNDKDWIRLFDCDHTTVEFSEDEGVLNGTNSGVCALNLAYIRRPHTLYMFGFDMCRSPSGEPYWYPPYHWVSPKGGTSNGKYQSWAHEFNDIALKFAEIETQVFNVSPASKINSFAKVSPEELGIT